MSRGPRGTERAGKQEQIWRPGGQKEPGRPECGTSGGI